MSSNNENLKSCEKKVLVLHPDDELKVIRFQDNLIQYFSDEFFKRENKAFENSGNPNRKILKIFPLWIPIENFVSKKNIISLRLGSLYCVKESDNIVNYLLPFFVKIKEQPEKEFQSDLIILKEFFKNEFTFEEIISDVSKIDLELKLNCKIFRIAVSHSEGSEYFLTDSEWKKL